MRNPSGAASAVDMTVEGRIREGLAVVSDVATSLYGPLHPAWRQSGAAEQEARRELRGGGLVNNPTWAATRATTIAARAQEPSGPWIAQMGYGPGGYHGDFPRWRDADGQHAKNASANVILADSPRLHVGDVLLDGS